MSYEEAKISEIVKRAVNHSWSVPEFQRGFVWKTTQVRDLAESLWYDYPIGSLLLWNSGSAQEERIAKDGASPSLWIVDGQQRSAALCILFGRKPYWWGSAEDWNRTLERYDIRFDIDATEGPFFLIANAAIRRTKSSKYVPLRELLKLDIEAVPADQEALMDLAKRVKGEDLCHGMDVLKVYSRLDGVRKIRDRSIVTVSVNHDLEEVVEIFARLNSRGTRVTEADIYLGVVASKNPGWVRDRFLPFLGELEQKGFHADPNLLFRTLTAIGAGSVRFKEIRDDFWTSDQIGAAWDRCRKAWGSVISRLHGYGVLSDDPLPTKAALVTLTALVDRFPNDPFDAAMYWFLEASRYGRYSGSSTTALGEDLRAVRDALSLKDAVIRMSSHIRSQPMTVDDFMRDYGDSRFGRFILYLVAYHREALDWDAAGHRLGFESGKLLADFRPQWHHTFPRKYLADHYPTEKIDALANIAVIGPTINIRISDQDPMAYIDKYSITNEKLAQQLIPTNRSTFALANYENFLMERAGQLANEANAFLNELRGDVAVNEDEAAPAAV